MKITVRFWSFKSVHSIWVQLTDHPLVPRAYAKTCIRQAKHLRLNHLATLNTQQEAKPLPTIGKGGLKFLKSGSPQSEHERNDWEIMMQLHAKMQVVVYITHLGSCAPSHPDTPPRLHTPTHHWCHESHQDSITNYVHLVLLMWCAVPHELWSPPYPELRSPIAHSPRWCHIHWKSKHARGLVRMSAILSFDNTSDSHITSQNKFVSVMVLHLDVLVVWECQTWSSDSQDATSLS